FLFAATRAKEPGKNGEDLRVGRLVVTAEQSGNIEPGVLGRAKRHGRTDDNTILGIASRIFNGEIFVGHFDADLELLAGQQDWSNDALSKSPLASTVPGVFFFEKQVHGPFVALAEFLSEQKADLISVRALRRPC